MLAPKWAHQPLGGDGAALHGGRFNERGMPALYMSAEFATAVAEYEQDLGIRPGTLCAYDVSVVSIVDLCDPETRRSAGVDPGDLRCPWKRIAFIDKGRPSSWDIARRLCDSGVDGIRVPSVQFAGGTNLVLWRWNDAPARTVRALDPLADLPRDRRRSGEVVSSRLCRQVTDLRSSREASVAGLAGLPQRRQRGSNFSAFAPSQKCRVSCVGRGWARFARAGRPAISASLLDIRGEGPQKS